MNAETQLPWGLHLAHRSKWRALSELGPRCVLYLETYIQHCLRSLWLVIYHPRGVFNIDPGHESPKLQQESPNMRLLTIVISYITVLQSVLAFVSALNTTLNIDKQLGSAECKRSNKSRLPHKKIN